MQHIRKRPRTSITNLDIINSRNIAHADSALKEEELADIALIKEMLLQEGLDDSIFTPSLENNTKTLNIPEPPPQKLESLEFE